MITTCLIIALAAAACGVTITRSRLFEVPRNYARDYRARSYPAFDNNGWRLLDALLHCPYCVVHWLVLVGCAIYRPRLVSSGLAPLDVLVTAAAVIAVAAVAAAVLCHAYRFAGAGE